MSNPYDPQGPASSNPYGQKPDGSYPGQYSAGQGGSQYGGQYGGGQQGGPGGPPPYGPPGGGGYGGPYGQPGGYGGQPHRSTDTLSIVAFVLSLTVCLSLIGAILGFVGLGRTGDGKRKGRWAAVAAIVIGLLGTAGGALGAFGLYQLGESFVTVDEAEAGLCINVDDEDDDAVVLRKKECTETHDAEVVYAGDAGADADTLESADAAQVCIGRVTAEDPELAAALADGGFVVNALVEDPADIAGSDRLVCYATPSSGTLDAKILP